jgi:hypothetical protein
VSTNAIMDTSGSVDEHLSVKQSDRDGVRPQFGGQIEQLGTQFEHKKTYPGDVAAWTAETVDDTGGNWVVAHREHDRHRAIAELRGLRGGRPGSTDNGKSRICAEKAYAPFDRAR